MRPVPRQAIGTGDATAPEDVEGAADGDIDAAARFALDQFEVGE